MTDGCVACEQIKYIDLASRRYVKITEAEPFDIVNISDAIIGIFDYQ